MPGEFVTLQVGQCGNQIGNRFWELALHEHDNASRRSVAREAMGSFFSLTEDCSSAAAERSRPLQGVRARAVLVDMEEGVVMQTMKGRLRGLFHNCQLITDVSGSGNNWAHGARLYGPQYKESLLEAVRQQVEKCEALQAFLLLHSLGGGTGSGLGSFLLSLLQDEFPGVSRVAASVFPSQNDDVVTSPYNCVLSAAALVEHADSVVCWENQALFDICTRLSTSLQPSLKPRSFSLPHGGGKRAGGAYDGMNGLAAQCLLDLTAGLRFPGNLNVDFSEIGTNLVPFPGLHFLQPALSPLSLSRDLRLLSGQPRSVDQMFTDVFQRENQLLSTDLRQGTLLVTALLIRGNISISDASCNVERLGKLLPMPFWNPGAFKWGLCSVPPSGSPHSILNLANSTSMGAAFSSLQARFSKLYKRRFFLHHYEQYMDPGEIGEAAARVAAVTEQYTALHQHADQASSPSVVAKRIRPVGLTFSSS